jgi:GNAT superfamily N-acetyltransferase
MKLVPADEPLTHEILDCTYDIWHERLSRVAYRRWWDAQRRTPWGRDHLQRFALVDSAGRLLSSAKRYRYDLVLDGRRGWLSGIGAVFTPAEHRGRGYASQLIEQLLEHDRRDGALVAALFSEIGPGYYERFGFRALPFTDVTVGVRRQGGAPAVLVRAGDERDLPAMAAMHDARSSTARLALDRSASMIHYAITKKRLFAGLSPPGLRQVEFVVAEEGASAVAYALLHQNVNGWTLEEAGDRDPAGARLGAILQTLVAREPAAPAPLIRAWWPSIFPVPPQLELTAPSPARDLFMIRALGEVDVPSRAEELFYWHSDAF